MNSVSPRSTKAEILTAYHDQALLLQAGPSWPQVGTKITRTGLSFFQEVALLVKDCYAAGRQARVWYDQVKAELTRPIFKA